MVPRPAAARGGGGGWGCLPRSVRNYLTDPVKGTQPSEHGMWQNEPWLSAEKRGVLLYQAVWLPALGYTKRHR